MYKILKRGLSGVVGMATLLTPSIALGSVTYNVDTTLAIGAINLTVKAGSAATSVVVGSTTVTVTTGAAQTFVLESGDKYQMTASPSRSITCTSTTSTMTIPEGVSEITITPTAVAATCPSSSGGAPSGGGGGGGGGGSAATTTTTSATSTTTTPAIIVYDVPDTGKASGAASVMHDTDKITLSIAKNTIFKTDVKKEKKVKYTETVAAPEFVQTSTVTTKSIPKNTSVVLAVQADTSKQVKLSRPAIMSIPLSADAQKLKLKAYYINENTGRAKYVVGGKINKATNSFVAKVRNLGGVLILVQKTPKVKK